MTQPPEYDLNETVVRDTATSQGALSPTTRLLLIALGILALGGLAWWLLQRNQAAEPITETPPPITTPATQGSTEGSGETVSQPGNVGSVDTPAVPALGNASTETTDTNGSTVDPTIVAAKPQGINPDQPLNSLGGSNPFKPAKLTPTEGQGSSTPATLPQPSQVSEPANVTITTPSSSPAAIDAALSSRPTTTSPSSDWSQTTASTTNSRNQPSVVAAPPTPKAPSISVSRPARETSTSGSTSGSAGSRLGSRNTSGNTASVGNRGNSGTVPSASSAKNPVAVDTTPAVPPVAGVTLPNNSSPSSSSSAGNGSGSNAAAVLPAPTSPGVLGSAGSSTSSSDSATSAPQATSGAIDSYLTSNQVSLNAAVLGPTSTAILKTSQGFVVATVGQAIPGTDIVLKSVTTENATLTLGNETKVLPLNN